MKVLAGPRLDLEPGGVAARLCDLLAGEDGEVVSLAARGLRNPYRRLSAAEVAAVREALRGEVGVVGYVCRGAAVPPAGHAGGAVVVTDHVNLTWRSPLTGPNDDAVGPRFPAMDGIYAAEVAARCGESGDIPLTPGVVAGVADDRTPATEVTEAAARHDWVAVSCELVAPVIVAAHMGLRVAALVLV